MPVMKVKEVPLLEIKVKDRARIDLGDIEELAQSIKDKGLLQPITIDEKMQLLAGERRFRAHQAAGITTISCIVRDTKGSKLDAMEIELIENSMRKDLTWPEQARLEKRIFDYMREHKNAGWSQADQQLVRGDPKSSINRRLQLAEALDLMPELADYESQDDAWKEFKKLEEEVAINMMARKVPEHVLKAPEWATEHYQIGDAFEGMEAFLNTQPQSKGQLFHFAEVDPPYGVDLHRRKSRNSDSRPMAEYEEWDDYARLFERTAGLVYECLHPNAFAVFWYGMSWHSETLATLRKVGFGVPDIPAIWNKGEIGQTASPDTTFGSCYEPFYVARKGQPKLARPGRGNVFSYPGVQKKHHPTEKPLHLLEEIIRVICFPGARILVPFLGSGVSLRAAYRLGHTGMGWDLSAKHKDGFLQKVADDIKEDQRQQEEEAINA